MPTKIADSEISNDQLIQVISTGTPTASGVSKMRALLALRQSASTRKAQVFSSVLANARELPRFKHMAVGGLLELRGVRAEQALVQSAGRADEYTAAAIALGLGRVGSPDALQAIRKLQRAAGPAARPRVEFAMSLLAYRHGLAGNEVRIPGGRDLLKLAAGAKTLPIAVASARQSDVTEATDTLKRQPLGVDLVQEGAQRINCGPNSFVLAWNKKFAGAKLSALREHKGLAGVLFLKSRFEKKYSISALALATPEQGEIRVTLHKLSGEVVFAGSATFENDRVADLSLSSVRRPGGAAIEFAGTFTNGRLKIKRARSATGVEPRRVARRDTAQ